MAIVNRTNHWASGGASPSASVVALMISSRRDIIGPHMARNMKAPKRRRCPRGG